MENKIDSNQLMKIIFGFIDNKDKLLQILEYLDLEKFKKGTISIHQDIINKTLYKEILDNLELIDFHLSFSNENVKIDFKKKIKEALKILGK